MTLVNLLMDMASAADRRGTERAAARLVTLLYPHLRRWGRADPDAEDIALEVLWRACTGASRCRAIHLPPGRERERQAWAWVWRIHGRVAIDAHRSRRLPVADPAPGIWWEDIEDRLDRACWLDAHRLAAEHAVLLVAEGVPAHLLARAREVRVPLTSQGVALCVDTFYRVSLGGKDHVSLASGGEERRAYNLVTKRVLRGRLALALGARRALTFVQDPRTHYALERLAHLLETPQRPRPALAA